MPGYTAQAIRPGARRPEESDEHSINLADYSLDGYHPKFPDGELLQPLAPELLPQGTVSPTQQAIIQQIITCPYQGALRKLFLEARFLNLFIEQHTHLTTA